MNYDGAVNNLRLIVAEESELLRLTPTPAARIDQPFLESRLLAGLLAAERRAAQESEALKAIESSLFPRKLPQVASLRYAGVSVGARQVGGDFYDFFSRGQGRVGIAMGDISGKGVAAALLRANLHATMRTVFSLVDDDMEGSLNLLNRLFYQSTPQNSYSTFFYAEYSDLTGALRYVNCGHPAALLVHSDGSLSRLPATCTVLGLFEEWHCSIAEMQLVPADTLLLYTDGIGEAFDDSGEEFGEDRLVDLLRSNSNRSTSGVLQAILDAVRRFSGGRQDDDVTLVGLRCMGFSA